MSISLSLPQRYKRTLQAMTLFVGILYMTLVIYQTAYGYPSLQGLPPVEQQQKEQLQQKEPSQTETFNLAIQQPTTVIIRKDMLSFNFSDIEVSERPSSLHRSNEHQRLSQRAVTGTPKPPTTELNDIFISVKTTKNYHDSRLALIIKTWFQLAKEQTWFFTDTHDSYYQEKTKGHFIKTNCSMGHFRKALCCKMSAELDVFLQSGKKWFCHFDDDNYVNIPRLVRLLEEYNPSQDWYLGKPSIASPLEILLDSKIPTETPSKKITFWFATGGAGFCLSRALTRRMLPIAGDGKFISIGDKIRFPDDVTMGFIIEHLLKVPLTVVDNFHSHLEPMEFIRPETFHDQVSFSYARMKNEWNIIKVDGFDLKKDPKRFYSLHCHLFPYFSFCPPR
ncbi:MFNG family protein [Megaselia abdita]